MYKGETRNVYRNSWDNTLTTHQNTCPKDVHRSSRGHPKDIKYPLTVL